MTDPAAAMPLDEAQAVLALAALSQSARLRVYRALVGAGPSGLTPGVLAAMLDLPASTLSFHLKALQGAGLVDVERASRHLIYRASVSRMNALLAYLTDHCCGGEPCGLVMPSLSPSTSPSLSPPKAPPKAPPMAPQTAPPVAPGRSPATASPPSPCAELAPSAPGPTPSCC